jgi:GntR family transcriptional regulator
MARVQYPYLAVADDLRGRIQRGELTGKLPTRMELAEEYGITHMTVQRALTLLKDEGLIYTVAGMGIYVAED